MPLAGHYQLNIIGKIGVGNDPSYTLASHYKELCQASLKSLPIMTDYYQSQSAYSCKTNNWVVTSAVYKLFN